MRVLVVALALLLAACSAADVAATRKALKVTPAPGPSAVALGDRLTSLLAGRNLPGMIHEAADPFYQAEINKAKGESHLKVGTDEAAVVEGAKAVKERLDTEAKARGDGDEQFLAFISLEVDRKAKGVSAASSWVNPEATPTPAPTPKPTPVPFPPDHGTAVDVASLKVGKIERKIDCKSAFPPFLFYTSFNNNSVSTRSSPVGSGVDVLYASYSFDIRYRYSWEAGTASVRCDGSATDPYSWAGESLEATASSAMCGVGFNAPPLSTPTVEILAATKNYPVSVGLGQTRCTE